MATTNVESVPITILSRCQRFNFKKFSLDDLMKQIRFVCEEEKISITDDAIREIAYLSEGGMRDALSLLDQLSANAMEITLDSILTNYGSISLKFIQDLLVDIANHDAKKIHEAMQELADTSSDYKIFIKKVIQELSNIAVLIATNTYQGNFTYEQVETLILSLNDCLNKINININPFLLIETIFLGSFMLDKKKNVDNYAENVDKLLENKAKEKQLVKKEEKNTEKTLNVTPSNIHEDEYLTQLIKIRVNNCFVNAKKEYLLEAKEVWSKVINDDSILPNIKSLLLDSSVVASSNDYCILSSKLESTVHLINKELDDLEEVLKKYFPVRKHFIALLDEEWKNEKSLYAKTIKNGGKYELMSEEELSSLKPKVYSEMEEIAQKVFNHDKIEMV